MLYKQHTTLPPPYIKEQLHKFFLEDEANNDHSTQLSLPRHHISKGVFIAEQTSIFVGHHILRQAYIDCTIDHCIQDGTYIKEGDEICRLEGNSVYILSRERVVLNLIQRLSGIAYLTKQYTDKVKNSHVKILDTRKTTPGLRLFEKYAVTQGGGFNHRLNLEHGIMIKDNHLACISDLSTTIQNIKKISPQKPIQVEVDNIDQLYTILELEVDSVLLDNMNKKQTLACVNYIRQHKEKSQIFIESSGGISLDNIHLYADTGVDALSIGAITHQAVNTNITLKFSHVNL